MRLQRRKASDLGGLDIFTPWLVVALLFYTLRRLEVWLHQHIFKVGWLVTKQYQTTTILYYAFFLPGILLNQFVYWAAAGFLNVRAERSIAWPEKQEIGELKLSFVQLSNTVGPIRLALISITPLLAGLFIVSQIANNSLNVPAFLNSMTSANASGDLISHITRFTSAPDFWIWFYLAFTISNTMIPRLENLRGWRYILGFLIVVVVALYAVGAGNQVIMDNLRGPITDTLNALSSVFAIIIGIDIFMVAVLGTIEAIIERVTGDSATFENGKMITMRRSELLAMKQAKALAPQPKPARPVRAASGPPSVYKLHFPIPGAPGKEAVTRDEGIVISPDPGRPLPAASKPDLRAGPAVITGMVANEKLPPPASSPALAPSSPARPALAPPTGAKPSDTATPSTTTPGMRPAASGTNPATPAARPAFSPSASPTSPATPGLRPAGAQPAAPGARSPLSPSPASTGALAGGRPAIPSNPSGVPPGSRPASPSSNPAGALPGTRPATSSPTASPLRSPVSSPLSSKPPSPAPKPSASVSPFGDEEDEEIEDMDDVFEDLDEELPSDEDDNDEVNYEDFEDPA